MLSAATRRSLRPQWLCRSIHTTKLPAEYKVGSTISGYNVENVVEVPKMAMVAVELREPNTGTRHVHVARDDPNNVFTIGFKTNPPNLTGLPHILEHTTLCGSKNFPVKDPFFAMLNRSLANFMNAMTGLDYTFYPFATTNHTDFQNLQRVYLDAVYNPLLRRKDFNQEGWRLEREDPEDPNSRLIFKGVVYNEMKGMMSDPSYYFYERFLRAIYPSLHSSGGVPSQITNLKYEELVEFQKTRYHPSNAMSFSYGDMPVEKVLAPLYDVVSSMGQQPLDSGVRKPVSLRQVINVETDGPIDPLFDENRQHKVSLTWVVTDSKDLDQLSVWKVLSMLLTSGHSSPLHRALIDSGIGTDFSVNTGLDELPGKGMFTVGLQGLSEETIPKFKEAVFNVLRDVAENGFPEDRLQAIINQVELSYREVEANYGLGMVSKLVSKVFNGVEPLDLVDDEKILDRFKNIVRTNPDVFKNEIDKMLLNKPYFEFTMNPSPTHEEEVAAEEERRLDKVVSNLSKEEVEEVDRAAKEAAEASKKEDDLSVLPTLSQEDIDRTKPPIEVSKESNGKGVNYFVRQTDTRGITYVQLLKNIHNSIPAHLSPYLSLFSYALTNVGTKDHDMSELENLIRLNTGGVDANLIARGDPRDSDKVTINFSVNGSSLDEKVSHVYEYMEQFLFKSRIDNVDKLRPLIQGIAASAMSDLSNSGHAFARRHAGASVSPKKRLDELLNGIEQVRFIKSVSAMDDAELRSKVVPHLEELSALVGKRTDLDAGLTFSGNEQLEINKGHIEGLQAKFGDVAATPASPLDLSLLPLRKTLIKLPFSVSYAGVVLRGANFTHPDSAPLRILASLLTHKYLHPEIREKGGAYGGGAGYSSLDGTFEFFSYRDPNPVNSLATISNSGKWVVGKDLTERDLLSAKLSVFQGLDSPLSPRSEINFELIHGLNNELRQEMRERILAVTLDDIKRVAEKYLIPSLDNFKASGVSVLGPSNDAFTGEDWSHLEVN